MRESWEDNKNEETNKNFSQKETLLQFAPNRGLRDFVDEKAKAYETSDIEGIEYCIEVGLVKLLVALCDDIKDVGRLEAVSLAVQGVSVRSKILKWI